MLLTASTGASDRQMTPVAGLDCSYAVFHTLTAMGTRVITKISFAVNLGCVIDASFLQMRPPIVRSAVLIICVKSGRGIINTVAAVTITIAVATDTIATWSNDANLSAAF